MKLTLYKSIAPINKVDKTKLLTKVSTLVGNFRNETSVLEPSIIIEYGGAQNLVLAEDKYVLADGDRVTSITLTSVILECNYAYIEEFNRYYFIKKVSSVNNKLWRIDMFVDTLMTFRNTILNSSFFVERQENNYNTAIKDNLLTYEEGYVTTKLDVGSDTPFIAQLPTGNTLSYVINSAYGYYGTNATDTELGEDNTKVIIRDYANPDQGSANLFVDLENLNKFIFTKYSGATVQISSKSYAISDLINQITVYPLDFTKLIKFNKKCTYSLDITPPVLTTFYTKELVTLDTTNKHLFNSFSYTLINKKLSTLLGSETKSFTMFSPISTYTLYIPYLGTNEIKIEDYVVPLSTNDNGLDNYFKVVLVFDINSNTMTAMCGITATENADLFDRALGRVINIFSGSCGYALPLDKTDVANLNNQLSTGKLNLALSGIMGATGVLAGSLLLASGVGTGAGLAMIGGSTYNFLNNVTKQVEVMNQPVSVTHQDANGQLDKNYNSIYPYLVRNSRKCSLTNEEYKMPAWREIRGYPCNKILTLKDCIGFTKTKGANLLFTEGISTADEVSTICTLLDTGVII